MASESTPPIAQTGEDFDELLKNLPRATLDELPNDESCPICLNTFMSIINGEIMGGATSVIRLKCGHAFCLDDISEWIHTPNGSCPTCRTIFLIIPELADDESSDGGEYIPGSDSMADNMMDTETWTDDEVEMWTDADEEVTDGSSQTGGEDMPEEDVLTLEQTFEGSIDVELDLGISQNAVCGDNGFEQIMSELDHWRTKIAPITVQDWVSKKDETRLLIHQGFAALRAIKPRIEVRSSESTAGLSLSHSIMAIVQEVHAEMQAKLDIIHDIDL